MDYRGGVGFARTTGVYGRAIRFAERVRHPIKGGTYWNHTFLSLGDGTVIQARARGVSLDLLDDIKGDIKIVPCPGDPEKFIQFHRNRLGQKYGWLTIFCQVVDIITPDWFPAFRMPGTWDCSALTGAALWHSGMDYPFRDVYLQRPSDIEGWVCGPFA